jgi:hypothetical protein
MPKHNQEVISRHKVSGALLLVRRRILWELHLTLSGPLRGMPAKLVKSGRWVSLSMESEMRETGLAEPCAKTAFVYSLSDVAGNWAEALVAVFRGFLSPNQQPGTQTG